MTIHTTCGKCGTPLQNTIDEKHGQPWFFVEPCWKCKDDAVARVLAKLSKAVDHGSLHGDQAGE